MQPTSRGDTVGFVDKLFLSVVVHKVFENLENLVGKGGGEVGKKKDED